MSSLLKKQIIILFFIPIFVNTLIFNLDNEIDSISHAFYDNFCYLLIVYFLFFLYLLKRKQLLSFIVFKKIIIFTTFLTFYFFIEQASIKIILYGVGGGGNIRHFILEDTFHIFTWQEVLYWNFIYSLYYPIYIFIFILPFVNHLSKSKVTPL